MADTFKKMTEEMKHHLCTVILPFWLRRRDDTYGGFCGYMDFDLKNDPKAVKGSILNSRILWFFSSVVRSYQRGLLTDQDLASGDATIDDVRKAADHAYVFLKEAFYDKENGGLFWSVTYDGKPYDTTKHTYNQGFGIYGLSAYYEITGDADALRIAESLYKVIETYCCDPDGYGEAYNIDFTPASNEKLSENGVMASRTMNTLLHVYEGYAKLLEAEDKSQVKESIAERLMFQLGIFAQKIYDPVKHRQEVFFDKDYNSLIDLHSYGHDIETAWLIRWGLSVLGKKNPEVEAMAVDLTDEILANCFDGHSLPTEKEKDKVNENRVWWVQAETVNGFLYEYAKTREDKYLEAAASEWSYIKTYSIDSRPGSEWFWELDKNGKPIPGRPIVEEWKCPYHNGRMVLLALELYKLVSDGEDAGEVLA